MELVQDHAQWWLLYLVTYFLKLILDFVFLLDLINLKYEDLLSGPTLCPSSTKNPLDFNVV
jgi:hypothetical protein